MTYYIITNPGTYDCTARQYEDFELAQKDHKQVYLDSGIDATLVASIDITPPAQYKVKLVITFNCDEYNFSPWRITKEETIPLVPFLGLEYKGLGSILRIGWTGEYLACELPDMHFGTKEQMNRDIKEIYEPGGWIAEALF